MLECVQAKQPKHAMIPGNDSFLCCCSLLPTIVQCSTLIKEKPQSSELHSEELYTAHLARAEVYSGLSERNVKAAKLTTEGQYPNSSRNSSGFRTTDSDHILPAATMFPSSASSATGTTIFTQVCARGLAPPRPLRAGKNHGFLGRRGAHPSTRPRYACHVGSGEKPRHCKEGR